MLSGSLLSYLKKKKNQPKQSLFVTRCHSLSLVVPLVVIRCTTRGHSLYHLLYHLLSLVVIRCHSLYYSLSLDVLLVCLFINDRFYNVKIYRYNGNTVFINDTLRDRLIFTHFSTGMTGWLLLIFLICLRNQLCSTHSIISTDV